MAKGTKVSIKVKGTAHGVKKDLSQIVSQAPTERNVLILREADFRAKAKREKN